MSGYNEELRNLKSEEDNTKVQVTQSIEIKIGKINTTLTKNEAESLYDQLSLIFRSRDIYIPTSSDLICRPWEITYNS